MATLALGVAGAAVGSIFGGPLGASIGWAIGSALGGLFEKKKGEEGPRLTDLHLQQSQYGLMIPIVYGTIRIAGNVIWQTDLVEHSVKSGGKGGGPTKTDYTYTASFAIMFCEGPILGIRRVWANKRLVWSSVQGQSDNAAFPFTLYTGTSSQLPDPSIEADKGVGNVSGHRGFAYIVLSDLPMEQFGNALPSVEAEIIGTENARIERVNTWPANITTSNGTAPNGITYDGTDIFISDYHAVPVDHYPLSYTRDQYSFDGNLIGNVVTISPLPDPNPGGGILAHFVPVANSTASWVFTFDGGAGYQGSWFSDGVETATGAVAVGSEVNDVPYYQDGAIFACGCDLSGGVAYIRKLNAPGQVCDGTVLASYTFVNPTAGVNFTPGGFSLTVADDGTVWASGTSFTADVPVWHFDNDLNLLNFWVLGLGTTATAAAAYWAVYNNYIAFRNGSQLMLYLFDGVSTFTLEDTYSGATSSGELVNLGGGYFLTVDGVYKIPQPITLKSIVDDVSVRCDLTLAQVYTDDLTQTVKGYVIGQQTDARSCLEPLMTSYFVDAVESGPRIKYVVRGAAPADTIPNDDLAAYAENEQVPALSPQVRGQEVDLPRSVSVSYFDINSDYQLGTQLEQRQVVDSILDTSIAFPIVFDATEGKAIASTIMYDSWAKRRRLKFSTSRKWAKLEPTDVVIVNGYTICITQRDEAQSGVISFDGVATRSSIFLQGAGIGVESIGFPPQEPPTSQPTQLRILDIPLTEDTDTLYGPYVAMAGMNDDTWGSASLFKSIDGGVTYTSLVSNSVADTMGVASTVLADFPCGNVFDNVNSVTVVIGNGGGELSSTSQLAVLNGANRCIIGDEELQYITATLTAPSTYVLTGLLRGRRGTEWAMPLHVADELFTALPTSVNVDGPYAELGLSRKYKAVTSGMTLASATAVDFTNTGIPARPYPPVQLHGGRNSSLDIIYDWTRRTRIAGGWKDYVDVPLGEASEKYYLTVYSDNTYTTAMYSAIVIAATTYTFTASAQIGSFGGVQTLTYWTVAQAGAYQPSLEARGVT